MAAAKKGLSHLTDDHLKQQILITQRQILIKNSRENMVDFCKIMMPDPEDPDDVTKTEYQDAGHSKMLCDIVQGIESGKTKRTAVAIPPQHGKTIHLSQIGLAWIWGRNPKARIIVATFNQTRADELGHEFRQMIKDRPVYNQVFPEIKFVKEAKSKSFMQNTAGGKIFFIGVGGTITGRTADIIMIDDPYKGDDDEFTQSHLERIWSWFFKVAYSRGSNKTRMCVIHCMTGDTPVLMENGVEKLLCDIRPGEMVASYNNGDIDVAFQLFSCGMVFDGNLVSKDSRDHLVNSGYAVRHDGMQAMTGKGSIAFILSPVIWRSAFRQWRNWRSNPFVVSAEKIKQAMA